MTVTSPPFPPCPRCGSTDAVEIIYGLPDMELGMAAERGEVVLGGCIVGDESPDYECRRCGTPLPWVRPSDEDDHEAEREGEPTDGFTLRCEEPVGYTSG
jgi:hypothetical protein